MMMSKEFSWSADDAEFRALIETAFNNHAPCTSKNFSCYSQVDITGRAVMLINEPRG